MQLPEIKKQIHFHKDLKLIFENHRNMAAQKYYAIERNRQEFYRYLDGLKSFLPFINTIIESNPLIIPDSPVYGLVLVTANLGFMKGLNTHVFDEYEKQSKTLSSRLSIIGERGAALVIPSKKEFKFFDDFDESSELEVRAKEVTDYLIEELFSKNIGKIRVIYPTAQSLSEHSIVSKDLFPINIEVKALDSKTKRKLILESNEEDLVRATLKNWIYFNLYDVFKESKLAEYSARTMHSDNAVHGVDKLIANFVKDYNDLRKEIVDKQTQEAGSVQKLLKKKAKRRYHELVLELERKTQAKNMELLPK